MPFPDIRKNNRFKDQLSACRDVLGTFIMVGGPEAVEICGAVGLDFVILDTEHTSTGWEKLSSMCLSALYADTFPLVRFGSTSRDLVTRALDIGARGVMFAQVQTADQALEAARACRYPPLGTRGAVSGRNVGWGISTGLAEYIEDANRGVVCVIQIETRESVSNVESIAAIPGVDCLFIGLSDLSVDLGAGSGAASRCRGCTRFGHCGSKSKRDSRRDSPRRHFTRCRLSPTWRVVLRHH